MFVLDTNILLDAANHSSPFHPPCIALLDRLRVGPDPWSLTWSVCYEFLRVSTHLNGFPSPLSAPQAVSFLESITASSRFQMLVAGEQHAAVLARTVQELPYVAGNVMHDLHIAVLMREHGFQRIYTRDGHFGKFKFLTVLDPLTVHP